MHVKITCECGCGEEPNAGKRYVHGHNARTRWAGLAYYEEKACGYKTPCWVWLRNHTDDGYGLAWDAARKRQTLAHRLYYERSKGAIPSESAGLDHLCRNHACVNPDHLQPVSVALNSRRGKRTRLTWDQVREIRASDETQRKLAARYGVHYTTICNIKTGKRWREGLERAW